MANFSHEGKKDRMACNMSFVFFSFMMSKMSEYPNSKRIIGRFA